MHVQKLCKGKKLKESGGYKSTLEIRVMARAHRLGSRNKV